MSSIILLSTVAAGVAGMGTLVLISKYSNARLPRTMQRLVAGAFAILSVKNMPGLWHIRVLRGMYYQLYFQPIPLKPRDLFKPLITSSSNTLYECDHNWHKSNSTYFSDLDVARAHTMSCVLHTGLARLNKGDEEGLPKAIVSTPGKYILSLGGVSCFFQRQIEPLQQFEIYTRILCWDWKWIYCVSHVVEKGAIQPDNYALQLGLKNKRSKDLKKDEEDLTRHIFASSIARYVCKKGRFSINPEIILERSHLLPQRPEGTGMPPRAERTADDTPYMAAIPVMGGHPAGSDGEAAETGARIGGAAAKASSEQDDWTWGDMERERLRGLSIASHFDGLSELHNEFRASEVLGEYGDYW